MPVAIREASSVMVRASPDAVARLLEARGARPVGRDRFELGEKSATGPLPSARRGGWYVLSGAPGGTRVVHGVALEPRNLAENLAVRLGRSRLANEVDRHLEDLKREAERSPSARRSFPPQAP